MVVTVGMVPRTAVPLEVGLRRFRTEQPRFVIFAVFNGQGCQRFSMVECEVKFLYSHG